MTEHECVLGVQHHWSGVELLTLPKIEAAISVRKKILSHLKENGVEINLKELTLEDYAKESAGNNFTRFDYCPKCGRRIGW